MPMCHPGRYLFDGGRVIIELKERMTSEHFEAVLEDALVELREAMKEPPDDAGKKGGRHRRPTVVCRLTRDGPKLSPRAALTLGRWRGSRLP
jgi:hypothetical protein